MVHEAARTWIETELARGLTLDEIRSDAAAFEGRILRRKVRIEAQLPPDALIFLDRALPDSIAYFEAAGLNPGPVWRLSRRWRYRRVYFCQPVGAPFQDGARTENAATSRELALSLSVTYERLGYRLQPLPAQPVSERLALILGDLTAVEKGSVATIATPPPPDRA